MRTLLWGAGRLALWILGGCLGLITTAMLLTDFATGLRFAIFVGLAIGSCRGLASAWNRRRQLAQDAVEGLSPTAAEAYRPSRVECIHPTRGEGWLVVDERGDLRFMANSAVASKYVAYFGMDLESCSVWRLIGRRLKVFFRPGVRKKLYGRDRNLTISRGQMRLVLPFRRFVLGPTVLIGYQGGGEETMRFEEFFLCTVGDNQVRTPTADADGWARDLGLPEAPAALRRLVQGRRTAVRRRLALADLGVAALVSGAILFILAGTYAVILATEAGAARGAMLFGTLAGVWAVTMALCTACHLYCHR